MRLSTGRGAGLFMGQECRQGTYNAPEHLVPAAEGDRQHGRTLLCVERHPSILIHGTWGRAGMGAETKAGNSRYL